MSGLQSGDPGHLELITRITVPSDQQYHRIFDKTRKMLINFRAAIKRMRVEKPISGNMRIRVS